MDIYIASDRAAWWHDHIAHDANIETLIPSADGQVRPGDIVAIDYMQFGLQGIRDMHAKYPLAQCIALCQNPSITETNQAFEYGVRAVWTLGMSAEEMSTSYSHCASRAAAISEIMSQHGSLVYNWTRLTKKERSIIRGSLIYDSANDLAAMNHSSPRTVEAHRYNVTRKLNDGTFRDIVVRYRRLIQALYHAGIDGQQMLDADTIAAPAQPELSAS